jgi:hypothetical protein
MLRLYQLGAEVPGHRKLLAEQGVTDVGLSFVGLSRRIKFARPWILDQKFSAESRILLDSGGYSIRASPEKYSPDELLELGEKYLTFVESNVGRVELVTDFDAPFFDPMRNRLQEIAGEKYLPIWHQEEGLEALESLADSFGRVGVPQTSVSGRDIAGVLTKLSKRGVALHGVAMTKVTLMQSVPWDSVASTSWLSPSQFGDSQIWTGHELKRYPKAYKELGRKRHRQYLKQHGFDTIAYESDDVTEVLKVALWSWKQLVDQINSRKRNIVTMTVDEPDPTNSEIGDETVRTQLPESRKSAPTAEVEKRGEKKLLPGFQLKQVKSVELGEDGQKVEKTVAHIDISTDSLMQCDSCYISERCPESRPGASCAYGIPIVLDTPAAKEAADNVVDTIRFKRIAFGHVIEQLEGGYMDPNLTKEIDAWDRSRSKKREEEKDTFTLTMKASSKAAAGSGMLSRMFGRDPADSQKALPVSVPAERIFEESGIAEAEIVGE